MNMPALAFFSRAMRRQVTGLWPCLFRSGLLAIAFLFLLAVFGASAGLSAPGLTAFQVVAFLNLAFITLAGFGYFATAITEEKSEMMLGLLKMTGLSPVSILLGKSTTRLLAALIVLLVQVPLSLLATTLGGVSWLQFWAVYAALAAYVIFLSSLGLLCSVLCASSTRAGMLTFAVVVLLFALPNLGAGLAGSGWLSGTVGAGVGQASDFLDECLVTSRFTEVFETGFSGAVVGVQFASNFLGGILLFLAAWGLFGLLTREQKEAAPRRGLLPRRTRAVRWLGAGRCWKRALTWKDFHFIAGGYSWGVGKLLVYAAVAALLTFSMAGEFEVPIFALVLQGVAVGGTLLEVSAFAGRLFNLEKTWKTLAGLMMLPMNLRELFGQKCLACLLALIPNAALFFFAFLLNPQDSAAYMVEILENPSLSGLVAGGLVLGTVFVMLVATFSLVLKHGALLVSVGIFVVGSCFVTPVFGIFGVMGGSGLQFAVAALVCGSVVFILGRMMVVLVRRAAAAE